MPNNTVYAMQNAIGNTNGTINQTSGPTVTAASTKEDNSAVQGVTSNAKDWKEDTRPENMMAETFCKNLPPCIPELCKPKIDFLCARVTACRDNIDAMKVFEAYRDQQIKLWNAECSEFVNIVDDPGGNRDEIGVISKGGDLPFPLLTKCMGYAHDIYDSSVPGWSKPWRPNGGKKPFPISGGPNAHDNMWRNAQFCYGNRGRGGTIAPLIPGIQSCLNQSRNPLNP